MKIRITEQFVDNRGNRFRPGALVEVDPQIAADWIRVGFATSAEPTAKPKPKPTAGVEIASTNPPETTTKKRGRPRKAPEKG